MSRAEKTSKLALCAVMCALAIVISTLESLLPIQAFIPLPGIKLGFANIVILFLLYKYGVFEAATIHYAVAKIFGPLIFGRGWCGYACWTAAVLDFLPFKTPRSPRKKIGWLRYPIFAASLIFVGALFLAKVGNVERIMFWAFIVGNILYYASGVALAFAFKDNRAFCKYLCPVTVFLKPASYFSLIRIKCDKTKCVGCGKCKRVCPMEVDVTDNSRKRKNGTECILCMECVKNCPKDAL